DLEYTQDRRAARYWEAILLSDRSLRRRKLRRLLGRGGSRLRGGLFLTLLENERITLAGNLTQAVHHGAGPGRNQTAYDDVLLEAFERVDLAVDRGLGQHPRGFLERCCRDERAGLQRRLGDAQQHRMPDGLLLALGPRPRIDLVQLDLVDLLAVDQFGLALLADLDLLQHLPDDHLDVLVIDGDALQSIDLLDLV